MTPYHARRIRFGILAARHTFSRGRMTVDQIEYLEGCELSGWKVADSWKAWNRECAAMRRRGWICA